jgi:hypothetical protein
MTIAVASICDALYALPGRGAGLGRSLMLIGAQPDLGVTEAARAVAENLGPGAVYAIDLDLRRNELAKHIAKDHTLGPRIDGALNGYIFHGAVDAKRRPIAPPPFGYHRAGRTRLYVGAIDPRLVPKGGQITLSTNGAYWNAARAGGAMSVVTAPCLDRSKAGPAVAQHMDGVVLVVGAGEGAAPAAMAAKAELEKAGAYIMGLVYSGASAPVMAIERLLRQAG